MIKLMPEALRPSDPDDFGKWYKVVNFVERESYNKDVCGIKREYLIYMMNKKRVKDSADKLVRALYGCAR